jgi:cell filamentation protein
LEFAGHPRFWYLSGCRKRECLQVREVTDERQGDDPLDLTKIDAHGWIEASKQAQLARYELMAKVLEKAL